MKKGKYKHSYKLIIILLITIGIGINNNLGINIIEQYTFIENTQDNLEEAIISKHADGDTIHVSIQNKNYKVRLIGVNTPEIGEREQPGGVAAKKYVENKIPIGTKVYLEKDISNTDKYGRLLRYMWLQKPKDRNIDDIKENMLNAILLQQGHAKAVEYKPDIKYAELFKTISK